MVFVLLCLANKASVRFFKHGQTIAGFYPWVMVWFHAVVHHLPKLLEVALICQGLLVSLVQTARGFRDVRDCLEDVLVGYARWPSEALLPCLHAACLGYH